MPFAYIPPSITAEDIWDHLTAGMVTVGSIGLLLNTNIDEAISAPKTLVFVEIHDGAIADGVSITPTQDGLFQFQWNFGATGEGLIEAWSDNAAAWQQIGDARVLENNFTRIFIGQDSDIRVRNASGNARSVVITALGG